MRRLGSWGAAGLALLWVLSPAAAPPARAAFADGPPDAAVAPVGVRASSRAPDVDPGNLIDGSGLLPAKPGGPGVRTHSAAKYADGGAMWTLGYDQGTRGSLTLDLGAVRPVRGLRVWNYNEAKWTFRGVKDFDLSLSADGRKFRPAGSFTLRQAGGTDDEPAQDLRLKPPARARYLKLDLRSNFSGTDVAGLSELRVLVAEPAGGSTTARAPYPRPRQPPPPRPGSSPIPGGIRYPADSGVIDVTKPPDLARGDGRTDDTAAIQRALNDHKGIIYLPDGVYLVSAQLRWGLENGWPASFTTLRGQSRDGTVIRLKDHCPGFQDPRAPRGVVWTGEGQSADRFANAVRNVTVHTGEGNPGASGVQFISNNMGTVSDVTIVSGDGAGVAGLDLSYTNLIGPLLVKNVRVRGFDYGLKTAGGVNSQVAENLTVEHQNVAGVFNGGQPLTVRALTSTNAPDVPAVVNKGGFLTLLDSRLRASTAAEGAARGPAVVNRAAVFARDVTTSGYLRALDDRASDRGGVAGAVVTEYTSSPPTTLFPARDTASLRLEIKETPEVPWSDPATWASPRRFVADPKELETDATAALQKAVDSGADTVYLPPGKYKVAGTVQVRGKVRRVVGCMASFDLPPRDSPAFRLVDAPGSPAVVAFEEFEGGYTPTPVFDNASNRTMVLRHCINTPAAFTGPGDVFIEDLCTNPQAGLKLGRQRVWARQLNVENEGLHTLNDGGTLWVLGYKTERGGTLIETRKGGRTEVLGGFSYTTTAGKLAPMFVLDESEGTFAFAEVCFNGDPFAVLVRESRDGQTRDLKPDRGRTSPLFVGRK